jgi:two-component system OmpR family response regulator
MSLHGATSPLNNEAENRGIRILMVEDDSDLRKALADCLRAGYAVDAYASGHSAIDAARRNEYGLAIVDLGLPDIQGSSLIRSLRRSGYVFPVLVITALPDIEERVAALDAGATDYMTKPFSMGELEERINVLLRRRRLDQSSTTIQIGSIVLTPGDPRILIRDRPVFLPGQELILLEVLGRNVGRVVSTATLAVQLSRTSKPVTGTAVSVHMHRLRSRLNAAGVQIRTLRGFGYLLEEAPD